MKMLNTERANESTRSPGASSATAARVVTQQVDDDDTSHRDGHPDRDLDGEDVHQLAETRAVSRHPTNEQPVESEPHGRGDDLEVGEGEDEDSDLRRPDRPC
jgi:hypothetical protein